MKGPHTGVAGTDWHLADAPCSFQGIPGECLGELTLVNASDAKVKVRALPTQTASKRKDRLALAPTQITLAAKLSPRGETRTAAALQLPPDTAPGQYHAVVVCGKQKIPVDIEVLEHRELHIEPNHLRFQAAVGETVQGQLCISNLGNVPVELGDVGMIWLREKDWIGRTVVYTLRETLPEESYEGFANRLLHDFHRDLIPPSKILFEPAKIAVVDAGKTVRRGLRMTVPAGCKKGRHYLGFIKINDARIWLELYCTGDRPPDIN